jgi:hypothetical protein
MQNAAIARHFAFCAASSMPMNARIQSPSAEPHLHLHQLPAKNITLVQAGRIAPRGLTGILHIAIVCL